MRKFIQCYNKFSEDSSVVLKKILSGKLLDEPVSLEPGHLRTVPAILYEREEKNVCFLFYCFTDTHNDEKNKKSVRV